jgi:hypothetical protein
LEVVILSEVSIERRSILEGETTFEQLDEAIEQMQSKAVFETVTSALIQHFGVRNHRNKKLNSSRQRVFLKRTL